MDADDGYSVALMRRHGVTERTVDTLAGISRAFRQYIDDVAVDRVVADGDELRRRRADAGRCASAPATARPTRCWPATALLLAGDHLLEKISSNPIAHVADRRRRPRRAGRGRRTGRARW